ncbi:beta-lactamase [Apiospora phragmitis]|uniref:Beta-lactamase n=1 Tax=Apiospora phragmitis TaxID=2905665 RepID=A0ABR1WSW9_9PEZI
MAQIQGTCDPRFEKFRTLFQGFLDAGEEVGASLTVNLSGENVVDLYGGHANAERTRPWTCDTIVPVASLTKTVSALAVLMLVESGAIASVHDKVPKYWPEFAANGKEAVEIRHLLSHTSGVAGWEDEARMSEFITPAPLPGSGGGAGAMPPGFKPGPLFMKAIGNPAKSPGFCQTRAWRGGEQGVSNGYGNARALDTILSNITLAGGEDDDEKKKYLLSKPTVDLIFEEQARGADLAVGQNIRWGIGYGLSGDGRDATWVDDRLPVGGRIAYWGGSGGSLGIMDVDRKLTITYAMNVRSTILIGNTASTAYLKAIYEALGVEI